MKFKIDEETKVELLLQTLTMQQLLLDDEVDKVLELIRIDEYERTLEGEWAEVSKGELESDLFLRMTPNMKELYAQKSGYDYAMYAYKLSVKDFLEEFNDYLDVAGVTENWDYLMESVQDANVSFDFELMGIHFNLGERKPEELAVDNLTLELDATHKDNKSKESLKEIKIIH